MKRLFISAFFLAVLAQFLECRVIKGSPTAYSNGSYVIIRWVSEDETGSSLRITVSERESGVLRRVGCADVEFTDEGKQLVV